MSIRVPDRLGFNLINGICDCSTLLDTLAPFTKGRFDGQTNAGIERLLENGCFDESSQRVGSADSLLGGGGVHDRYSPSKEASGEGVMYKVASSEVISLGGFVGRSSIMPLALSVTQVLRVASHRTVIR